MTTHPKAPPDDVEFLKQRVAHWRDRLTSLYEEIGPGEFINSCAAMRANDDAIRRYQARQEAQSLPELPRQAAAWVIPGDDGGSLKNWVDAKLFSEDEFTKPLYTADQMRAYGELCRKGKP